MAWKSPEKIKKTVYIKFVDLFIDHYFSDYKCEHCNRKNEKLPTKVFYNFDQTRYCLIRIEPTLNITYYLNNVKITDFNPDFLQIPGSDCTFFVKSAIMHYPTDFDNPRSSSHYTCIKRVDHNEWIEINDLIESPKHLQQFPEHLSFVYILLLEKFS